jgi:hypothetical protein
MAQADGHDGEEIASIVGSDGSVQHVSNAGGELGGA